MTDRKLASIRRIDRLEAIEGADNIHLAHVDGWRLVTAKNNGFVANDLCCYFEIDSFLPIEERYEFLRKGCYKNTTNLGEGFRIKTIKLKGQLSQGLIMPLDRGDGVYLITDAQGNKHEVSEGDDVTELLNVKKYEKPIPVNMRGEMKGNFPVFLHKTDQERIQNCLKYFMDRLHEPWEVTLKLDGSSMTVYKKGDTIGVCSRNVDLVENSENLFWRTALKLKLPEVLKWYGRNLALQGELMGPGVQGNREWLKDHSFFLFDIWDIDAGRYFTPAERATFVRNVRDSSFELPTVYDFGTKKLADFGSTREEILSGLLKFAEGPSMYHEVREGVVFRSHSGLDSFKVISNAFLLAEKG